MSLTGLERLDVWRRAKEFALAVYKNALPALPAEEKWAMAQQLRRAAQSIPANIAEGHGRFYFQENVRFCYIARGSLEETVSFLVLAYELGYLSESAYSTLISQSEDLTRLLNGYIAYFKKTKRGKDEPGAQSLIKEDSTDYLYDFAEEESGDIEIE